MKHWAILLTAAGALVTGWLVIKSNFVTPQVSKDEPVDARPLASSRIANSDAKTAQSRTDEKAENVAQERPQPRPQYLAALLADGRTTVEPNLVQSQPLAPAQVEELITRYRNIDGVTNRIGIARVLATHGSDEIAELFLDTLLHEYAGRHITSSEEMSQLASLTDLIGCVARRSDRALDILRQGTAPEFWRRRSNWTSTVPADVVEQWLTAGCIQGLQTSRRPEAWPVVLDLASNAPPEFLSLYAGTFLEAAYWHDQTGSATGLKGGPGGFNGQLERYRAWKSTDTGRQWNAWYRRHTQESQ